MLTERPGATFLDTFWWSKKYILCGHMYTKLFNELTDIMNDLENIKERIKKVQLETEEIYINNEA